MQRMHVKIIVSIFLIAAMVAGCGGKREETAALRDHARESFAQEEASETSAETSALMTDALALLEQGLLVVNMNFNHMEFIDNIGFILPSGWTYDTYERIDAGADMDSREWGIHVYVNGSPENEIVIYGTRQRTETVSGQAEDFVTGMGMTGQRYVREIAHGQRTVRVDDIIFDAQEPDFAEYRVHCILGTDVYENNLNIVTEFLKGINIVCAAREEEQP